MSKTDMKYLGKVKLQDQDVDEMKNVIEQHCPVINRINPASVLSDAFYCLSVYDDAVRYRRCILILIIMCLLCISFSFLMIRRERYDSI